MGHMRLNVRCMRMNAWTIIGKSGRSVGMGMMGGGATGAITEGCRCRWLGITCVGEM